jgi:N-acetylglucosamine kinase-like BadF-type ATPase
VYSVSSVVTPNTYKIGVDGGGTKTELILVDAAGEIVARHLARGCNPSQTGTEAARTILTEALAALLAQSKIPPVSDLPSPISHTQLYMAGSPPFWAEVAASFKDFGQVTSAADSAPVLELATAGAPGIVLHAGTGSFVITRSPDGNVHYTGGLGWKFGDPGSGFDLGRRAIALALLELQANPPLSSDARPSPLAEALVNHTGLMDYAANSRYFYTDPAANATIASFAPHVLALAAEECGPAQQVVADSVTELARLADGVIHNYFPGATAKLPCGVSGKILNSVPGAFALRSLANKLNWPVELNFITTPPIEGVRRLLLKS